MMANAMILILAALSASSSTLHIHQSNVIPRERLLPVRSRHRPSLCTSHRISGPKRAERGNVICSAARIPDDEWSSMWRDADARIVEAWGDGKETSRLRHFARYLYRQEEIPRDDLADGQLVNRAYFPGLTARPWWDESGFPAANVLEGRAQEILSAHRNVQALVSNTARFDKTSHDGYGVDQLMVSGTRTPAFESVRYTRLVRTLVEAGLDDSPRSIMLSSQAPGTGLPSHSDELNFVLTLHLGLEVPRQGSVWIEVAGERRTWAEGKAIVFDSSFEHKTVNEGKSARHILLVDLWHPELTEVEKDGIIWLYRFRSEWLARYLAPIWDAKQKFRGLSTPGHVKRKGERIYYEISPPPPQLPALHLPLRDIAAKQWTKTKR